MIFFLTLFQLDEPRAFTITTVVIITEISGPFLHQHKYQHICGMHGENLQGKEKVSPVPPANRIPLYAYQLLSCSKRVNAYTSLYECIQFTLGK